MTAPFFLVPPGSLVGDVGALVTLEGPEGRHAATVKRLGVGEAVLLGDGRGRVVDGVVAAVPARDRLEVTVTSCTDHPVPAPRLTVVQAIAKGERGELSVELMTEVGVDVVVPWAASRSVAQWRGEKVARGLERWRATAREAAKQSRRPWVPDVLDVAGTGDVAALVAATVQGGGTALVLHEEAEERLSALRPSGAGDVLLVVGPEGGLTDDEVARFASAGAVAVRLGPSVLRTSTAGAVAAAVLLAASGRWD